MLKYGAGVKCGPPSGDDSDTQYLDGNVRRDGAVGADGKFGRWLQDGTLLSFDECAKMCLESGTCLNFQFQTTGGSASCWFYNTDFSTTNLDYTASSEWYCGVKAVAGT